VEKLNLDETIRADLGRYKRVLEMYRSRTASEDVGAYLSENIKETERHLENVIRELEALMRERRP
jgi:hypothetical protein